MASEASNVLELYCILGLAEVCPKSEKTQLRLLMSWH